MLRQRRILKLAVAGLVAAAVAPGAAVAAPAASLPDVAAGGGTAITPQWFRALERRDAPVRASAAPQWPLHPQVLRPPREARSSSGDGDAVLIAGLGGLALICAGGLGIVYRDRARGAA
jgi:hypothetical protein